MFGGFLLACLGGYINCTALVSHWTESVSHQSGNVTRLAMAVASSDPATTLQLGSILLCFIAGAALSGALIGHRNFKLNRRYGVAMLIESAALAVACFCLHHPDSERDTAPAPTVLLDLLGLCITAFACGLQNGLVTTYSNAIVRTTHVTGLCTDVGLVLGQALFYERGRRGLWRLKVQVPLLAGFWLGGVFGALSYTAVQAWALAPPAAVAAAFGLVTLLGADRLAKRAQRSWRLPSPGIVLPIALPKGRSMWKLERSPSPSELTTSTSTTAPPSPPPSVTPGADTPPGPPKPPAGAVVSPAGRSSWVGSGGGVRAAAWPPS